ncbi:hypothetical protein [Halobacillus litoralis]|uniref:hypothetical protein n=1 Tax=Halobacillus litoralis TaxID=45668 RepID=UPI001CD336FF|nr:hypothetical protein [Halobacillus litoralis]MCA1021626.1 hypothetical protein [Halobacillus litoralis]
MYKYNERQYAERILKDGFTNKKYTNSEMRLLAKYYKEQGHPPREREKLLYNFCEKHIEGFSKVNYFRQVNAALNHAKKKISKLIEIECVHISSSELSVIDSLQIEKPLKKILLTLLVLDKIHKQIQVLREGEVSNREHYFGGSVKAYKDLLDSSKVTKAEMKSIECKNVHDMIALLADYGLVEIRNNGVIKSLFIYDIYPEDGSVIEVKGYDRIGLYYDLHIGEKRVKECEECSLPIRVTSNRTKFCTDCWKEREKELRREINRKYYAKRN